MTTLFTGGVHVWSVKVEGVHDRLSVGVISEERLSKDSIKNKYLPHLPDTWMWTPSGFASNGAPVSANYGGPSTTFRSGDVLWFILDCDAAGLAHFPQHHILLLRRLATRLSLCHLSLSLSL